MNPLGHFVQARLHRRIFLWFGATILLTGAVVATLTWGLSSRESGSWFRQVDRIRRFASSQFARVWDDAAARDALALSLNRDLEVSLRLLDVEGRELFSAGRPCRFEHTLPIVREPDTRLGTLQICLPNNRTHPGFPVALVASIVVLWAASGALARRLTRPLVEVARVARELGAGNLGARMKLRARHGEVRVVSDALNDMAARIERQLKEQRELLAAVSHELRTPLARVRVLLQMLREGNAGPRLAEDLDREVMDMDSLVGQLLASARVEFQAMTPRPLDGVRAAQEALERAGLAGSLLKAKGQDFILEADPTLLARALANLIENAQHHGGGLRELVVEATGSSLRFTARDEGPGFASGQLLFEPFQRGIDSSQGQLGLGLSLVKRIAAAHGGTASARNGGAGGAEVTLELPRSSGSSTKETRSK